MYISWKAGQICGISRNCCSGRKISKKKRFILPISAKDIGKLKSPLDRLFEQERGGVKG